MQSLKSTIACSECGMLFMFYIQGTEDGLRRVVCRHCGATQIVYVKLKTVVVPVIVGRTEKE